MSAANRVSVLRRPENPVVTQDTASDYLISLALILLHTRATMRKWNRAFLNCHKRFYKIV